MPRLSFFFARRYLFAPKSHSVINIISGVSAFAVAIPVAAMVILLSVFNGFESMIKGMHQRFDADIEITPRSGKVFRIEEFPSAQLQALPGIMACSFELEENALFEYRDRQFIGIIRGVDSLYGEVLPMDSIVSEGQYRLRWGELPEVFVGQGVAYALGVRVSLNDPMVIYTPSRGGISSPLLPYSIYRKERAYPSGIFQLDASVDGQYVISSLDFAQKLLNHSGKASSVSIRLSPGASPEKVQAEIQKRVGDEFKVLTRYQQNETFYRIMMYEKWGIYFIILLVLIVASFSLIGSLVMLIIDKKEERRTLITLGADIPFIRRIFVTQGLLIYGIGALTGMILGLGFALVQQHFGIIGISGDTFLVDAYPVEVHAMDLVYVALSFTAVSYLIARLTVQAMLPKEAIRLH